MYTTAAFYGIRVDVRLLRLDVLRAIPRLANDRGGVSYERIAEDLSCNRVTVWRHIEALKASGYVEAVGNHKPVRYRLTEQGQQVLDGRKLS